ncbi:MAG TPA: TRAP transporter small permease [Arenicellales bacterium]|nr:TRAP transporter small permease [Arenicellales bacterium]
MNAAGVVYRFASYWAYLAGVMLLAIVAVTMANVTAFGLDRLLAFTGVDIQGLPGYEDFVRLAVSAAALMFIPWCQARRGHVAVDFFVDMMPEPVQRALDALWLLLTAGLGAFLAYWMAIGMLETYSDHVLSRVLGWPEWPFYLPGTISMALWSLIAVLQLAGRSPADV